MDLSDSGKALVRGSVEHGNDISVSVKGGEILDQVKDCYVNWHDFSPQT
jgi:hypothetical protein